MEVGQGTVLGGKTNMAGPEVSGERLMRSSGRVGGGATIRFPGRQRLRVVIADGDPLARRALRDVFQRGDDVAVVAEASDGVEALELATYYRPDVLLSALELARIDGLELVERVRVGVPEVRVVFLTVPCSLDTEVGALRSGACGFLSKDMPIEAISGVLQRVARGEATVSPAATAYLVARLRELPKAGTGVRPVRSALTSREWEVVDLLGAGLQPAEIAGRLALSRDTVRSHLKHIMRKLRVRTTADIVAAADRACSSSEMMC
jgi:DNA-binding NarL/FixJ family response regulator